MKKKHLIIIAVLSILTGSFVSASFLILPAISSEPDTFTMSVEAKHPERTIIHLYFANKENSFLIAEKRLLVQPDDPAQMGKLIIESLIKGPKEGLMRTISSDATLRALFVTEDKTAYADFSSVIREKHPGGCKSEIITIYSIVNSLILNIPEIDAVKILIDGRESMTLAGHIDLRFPLKADMLLVR
ncbi:MAG: GerMN domain-containing protein [Deltaproteobacteria bacterium]|nr:GerMN domain-containing protein [Deltaproteobacteria bacterium]